MTDSTNNKNLRTNKLKTLVVKHAGALIVFAFTAFFFYLFVFNYKSDFFSLNAMSLSLFFAATAIWILFYGPMAYVAIISKETGDLSNLKPFLSNKLSFEFLPLSISELDKWKSLAKLGSGYYDYGAHKLYINEVQNTGDNFIAEFQFKSFEAKGSGHLFFFKGKTHTMPLYLIYRPAEKKPKISLGWKSMEGSEWFYRTAGAWMGIFGFEVFGKSQVKQLIQRIEKEVPQFKSGTSYSSIEHDRLLLTKERIPISLIEIAQRLASFNDE